LVFSRKSGGVHTQQFSPPCDGVRCRRSDQVISAQDFQRRYFPWQPLLVTMSLLRPKPHSSHRRRQGRFPHASGQSVGEANAPTPGHFEPCCDECGGHHGFPKVFIPAAGGRTLPGAGRDLNLQQDWAGALQGEGGEEEKPLWS